MMSISNRMVHLLPTTLLPVLPATPPQLLKPLLLQPKGKKKRSSARTILSAWQSSNWASPSYDGRHHSTTRSATVFTIVPIAARDYSIPRANTIAALVGLASSGRRRATLPCLENGMGGWNADVANVEDTSAMCSPMGRGEWTLNAVYWRTCRNQTYRWETQTMQVRERQDIA